MLPFFNARRRRKSRRHRYRPSHANRESSHQDTQNSASQMLPGKRPPYQLGHVGTSTSVPSYLRPEQASTPYQEEGDDPDSGYILGAFHDDYAPPHHLPANHAQAPPTSASQGPTAAVPSTGFTRVKGGRANFEDPFAIRADSAAFHPRQPPVNAEERRHQRSGSGSAQAFPAYPLPNSYTQVVDAPTPSPAPAASAATRVLHGRKKSETAIIEDVSLLSSNGQPSRPTPPSPTAYRNESPLPPPAIFTSNDDDYSTDSSVRPRRKFWFGKSASDPTGDDSDAGHDSDHGAKQGRWPWSRGRNRSDPENRPAPVVEPPATKSFSVVRQPRPMRPVPQGGPSAWRRPSTAPDHGDEDELEMSPPATPKASTWSRRQSSPFS